MTNRFLQRLMSHKQPVADPRLAPMEPAKIDTAQLDMDPECRRDYFIPGGYGAVRAPGHNERLETWITSELNRAGLPSDLRAHVIHLAAIAIKKGSTAAREALNADLSIPERFHFAIEQILKSIPPLV